MKSLVTTFKALSDPARLRIIVLLLRRDLCVCELTAVLGMEQSRISHQLRILRVAGLVEDVRDGKWIIYHVPTSVRRGLGPFIGKQVRAGAIGKAAVASDLKKLAPCLRESARRERVPDAKSTERRT
jgi:ArsR family transcriptional regulator